MKSITAILTLLTLSLSYLPVSAHAQTAQTQAQIAGINTQIANLTVEIENKKLLAFQAKAGSNPRSAQIHETEIKRYTDQLAIRRSELSMWQQQANFEKQVPSPNPQIQAIKVRIQQLTFERAKLTIQQTQANQTGNKVVADGYTKQITMKQAEITAKQQEIRLIETKAKAAAITTSK
ncbi:MAG: hypothetical protein RL088_3400 [Verrucomicrobiota bacterium]|jgi:regulator of replication initiation timing